MERPAKVFLDEPIKLFGIEVKHTEAGCIYYADHFQKVLDLALAQKKITPELAEHMRKRIDQYKQYTELYGRMAANQADGNAGTEKL